MTKIFYFLVIFFCCFSACNQGGGADSASSSGEFVPEVPEVAIGANFDVESRLANRTRLLPSACAIVRRNEVAEVLGLTVQDLIVTNSTPRDRNPTHSSCFYKWDDGILSNAGVMLQMMRNPNEEEFPDYVSAFIHAFRTKGERGLDEAPIIYEEFHGFGDDGAYSIEGGKYFWRLGEKIIFGIAFNTSHSPEEQYRIATDFAKLMTERFMKI